MPQRRQTLGLKSFSPEGEGFYQKWDNKIVKLGVAGICATSLLLSGCMAAYNNYSSQQFETTSMPATAPQAIVLASNMPLCKYQNLGSVSVRDITFMGTGRSGADIKNDLQTEAAKMGGNAVIGIKFNLEFYEGSIVYITDIQNCKSIQNF